MTKYLPSGEKARAVMVFLQRDEAGSEGYWHPSLSLTPSQSLQKARPADTNGTCGTSLSGSGAPPGPSRQSHRNRRWCPPLRRRRSFLGVQTHLPGTVEDVMLFVFPRIEQHDHTPGEMSETTASAPTAAPPGAPRPSGNCSHPAEEAARWSKLGEAPLATEGS